MTLVTCPVCGKEVPEFYINSHLDKNCSSQHVKAAPPEQTAATTSQKRSSDVDSQDARRKRFKSSDAKRDAQPLAERMRPSCLDEFVGQDKLLGKGSLLRNLIESDRVGSMVLWGPPGTGKTTIARLIARHTKCAFREVSATTATTAELRGIFEEASNKLSLTGQRTILFVDEIQRFNKAQQDSFLPVVEAGTISLISSTTENPSFRLNNALLSRCRVFILDKLTPDDIYRILLRALQLTCFPEHEDVEVADLLSGPIDKELLDYLAAAADGDARVALSSLELAVAATDGGTKPVDKSRLKEQLRKAHLQYDRSGDHHYDTISALHKSVRGGDADAALYWLARMLEGGDDPLYVARRLIRMASEDIGLANSAALPQAIAAYQAAQLVGMPECDCILAHVVVMLAESPKSVRAYKAYGRAKQLVREQPNYPVPLHIRNAPTGLMKSIGYGKDYLYEPAYAHPVHQTFLPPELQGTAFLRDEDSLADKQFDGALLDEWETIHGPWPERPAVSARWQALQGTTENGAK